MKGAGTTQCLLKHKINMIFVFDLISNVVLILEFRTSFDEVEHVENYKWPKFRGLNFWGTRILLYHLHVALLNIWLSSGSRSTRAKPLHWTSCLKIAEDVAQGLAYIHQASSFIHGNLKSSNVLLGSDFEACITDYCLSTLADTSLDEDPDSIGYKAPEIRKSARKATAKSDVYAFGVLLLELLTGKPPNQHPFLAPPDMPDWVRAMREDDDEDDTRLRMLVEVASICSLTSPEQRPTMWQVLKMITNIKEIMDDSSREVQIGYSWYC